MSPHETPASASAPARDTPGAYPDESSQYNLEDAQPASDLTSLRNAVRARRAEYLRKRKARVKIGTWNVAALAGTEADIGKWFADSRKNDEAVEIYVLGLQEIVDVTSPAETLRPYVDPAPSNRWKDAVQSILPPDYKLVLSQQLMGLLLLIYASPSVDISSVSSSVVGTGLMGYMGNKGAVATRIVIGGTTKLVFVNCHLAAGADKASLERRNWDASQIVSRAKFNPVDEDDEIEQSGTTGLGEEEFGFWFGDLNYRLDGVPGEDVRRLLHLHTGGEYRSMGAQPLSEEADEDVRPLSPQSDHNGRSSSSSSDSEQRSTSPERSASPSSDIEAHLDPASVETTLASLLPHDQLHAQQRLGKALHQGWREGDIDFLPTYKYDVGSTGRFDSSEKQRSPSWCDRILYRTRSSYLEYKKRVREAEEAKKRDDELKSLGLDKDEADDNILFDYDPDVDAANDSGDYDETADATEDTAKPAQHEAGSDESISLTSYKSHQDINSSDHKPLEAEFILTYDAVVPELRSQIRQEIVRELDKAENEGRPGITIVQDPQNSDSSDDTSSPSDPNTVDFGEIRYDKPVVRNVTLANTSCVSATFSFCSRASPDEKSGNNLPPWLRLQVDWPDNNEGQKGKPCPEFTLPPGESTQVELTLHVADTEFVRELNAGHANLDHVLVLGVVGGQDYFIPVHGKWCSGFGKSLDELPPKPDDDEEGRENTARPRKGTGVLGFPGRYFRRGNGS